MDFTTQGLRELTLEVVRRVEALEAEQGRDHPVPSLHPRKLAALEAQAALEAAIAEQQREEEGLRQLGGEGGAAPDAAAALAAAS
jgi:hypothetical protein